MHGKSFNQIMSKCVPMLKGRFETIVALSPGRNISEGDIFVASFSSNLSLPSDASTIWLKGSKHLLSVSIAVTVSATSRRPLVSPPGPGPTSITVFPDKLPAPRTIFRIRFGSRIKCCPKLCLADSWKLLITSRSGGNLSGSKKLPYFSTLRILPLFYSHSSRQFDSLNEAISFCVSFPGDVHSCSMIW